MPYDPEDPETKAAVQAEVQRIAAGIRDDAKATGAKEREDTITAYLAEQAEAQRLASLEGEEKLRAEVADERTKREAAEQAAARLAADTAARAALLAGGFAPATLDDALKLLGDTTTVDLAAEVPALAQRIPALLNGSTSAAGAGPAPTPPPPPGGPGGAKSAAERAAERFASSPLAKTA